MSTIPATRCDGIISRGGVSYSTYRSDFNTRKVVANPIKISLAGSSYSSSSKSGTVKINITNTTGSPISGTMQVVVVETNVGFSWTGGSILYNVVRDMRPDQNGTAVSIPANGAIDKTQTFSINSGWNESTCSVVVFVQGSSKEVYQAAKYKL